MSLDLNTGSRGGDPEPRGEVLPLGQGHRPRVSWADVLDTLPRGTRPMPRVLFMTVNFLRGGLCQTTDPTVLWSRESSLCPGGCGGGRVWSCSSASPPLSRARVLQRAADQSLPGGSCGTVSEVGHVPPFGVSEAGRSRYRLPDGFYWVSFPDPALSCVSVTHSLEQEHQPPAPAGVARKRAASSRSQGAHPLPRS